MPRPRLLPSFATSEVSMSPIASSVLALSLLLLPLPHLARAQPVSDPSVEFASGRAEYMATCASCHGENADGLGPVAAYLTIPVPGLRDLAKENDGVFPLLRVIQIIDGRAMVRGHANPMPVFGQRYAVRIEQLGTLYGTEVIVRARVLELATYLQSIQN
jgi:hypothetical protein